MSKSLTKEEREQINRRLRVQAIQRMLGRIVVVTITAPGRSPKEVEGFLHKILNIGGENSAFWLIQKLDKKDENILFINQDYIVNFRIKNKTWAAIKNENEIKKGFELTELKKRRIIVDLVATNKKAINIEGILANILPLTKEKTFWFLKDISSKEDKTYNGLDHLFIAQTNIFRFELITGFWGNKKE